MELVMFILVLTVFLVAYGVVSQGLLYTQRKPDWAVLKDVIYYPYWQFYGELFLDEIDSTYIWQNGVNVSHRNSGHVMED